jgi:lysophospholipase L1-like esterase
MLNTAKMRIETILTRSHHTGIGVVCRLVLLMACCISPRLTSTSLAGDAYPESIAGKRVLVLGDSITYSGQYLAYLEAYLRLHVDIKGPDIINLGLPSETVSGLSEPGHAGGRFPRPDLHERLDRVLEAIQPDLVFACYGMNCGIYHPYSVERFEAYKVGIRRLRARVHAIGAAMIHVTPPVFDPVPIAQRTLPAGKRSYKQPYEGYDEVLSLYASWLVAMRGEGWKVIDVHRPMKSLLHRQREIEPHFRFASDGVHMNDQAHWMTAQWILKGLGASENLFRWPSAQAMSEARLGKSNGINAIIKKRQRLLCDAWLTKTAHLRPGMSKGLPLDQATEQAHQLESQIQDLLRRK